MTSKTSQAIRQIRADTGLTQSQFADALNIPLRTIEDWEAGKRNPPQYVVDLIAYKMKKK